MPPTESTLDQFVKEAETVDWPSLAKATDLRHGKTLLALPHAQKATLLVDVIDRLLALLPKVPPRYSSADLVWRSSTLLLTLLGALLRSKFDLDATVIERLVNIATFERGIGGSINKILPLIRTIEQYAEYHDLSPTMKSSLEKLRKTYDYEYPASDHRKLAARLAALLAGPSAAQKPLLEPAEAWSDQALADLAAMKDPARTAWAALLDLCKNARGSKPANAWCKKVRSAIDSIGPEQFSARTRAWFALVGKPAQERTIMTNMGEITDATLITDSNADVLKGLAWAAGATGDSSLAGPLADLAEATFKKIPRLGARCPRAAGACLAALNLLPGHEPVGQLTRLRARVKQPSARAAVDRAINRSAQALGVTPEDVEEMSTPTFGLNAQGKLTQPLGSFTAELTIVGTSDVTLTWRGANGKTVKSIPAEVKRHHAEPLKALLRTQKDLQKILPAHAHRLERLLAQRRQWPVSSWRQRYPDHPVLGPISRRLIWEFMGKQPRLAVFHEGKFESADGSTFNPDDDAQVRLWHPIDSPPDLVLAWRRWLESHDVTQPFKQAHREIYILTDAERQTAVYSNRFAGHVLRQHQFHALCQARGWQYRLMGSFDGYNTPFLDLPRHDLRVEFWVQQPDNDQLSHAGINLHILTDQVRFCRRSDSEPMALEQIDPIVFSETLRDIDLFVGVASVGNDPTWHDGGPDGRFRDYWQNYSFGELSQSAHTRKAVLQNLLPRLTRIKDRCSLSDRFLTVRGDLRTYKIHLGSANILMAPNDQYLCIVPSHQKDPAANVFLPFEGDPTLSIILSKAFLLAEDKKITDPTITRQITPR